MVADIYWDVPSILYRAEIIAVLFDLLGHDLSASKLGCAILERTFCPASITRYDIGDPFADAFMEDHR